MVPPPRQLIPNQWKCETKMVAMRPVCDHHLVVVVVVVVVVKSVVWLGGVILPLTTCRLKLRFNLYAMRMWRTNANEKCYSGTSVIVPACGMCYSVEVLCMNWFSNRIKHSPLHQLLHATIHFVTFAVRIWTNGITLLLILCFWFRVTFTFVIRIQITHKWNLSF